MKILLVITLLLKCNFSICQRSSDSILLKIESYPDTVSDDKNGYIVIVELINNSSYPIILSNRLIPSLHAKFIELDRNKQDTLDDKYFFENGDIDYYTPEEYEILKQKQSKKIEYSLREGFIFRKGNYKVKLIYELKKLNKNYTDIESDWFTFYLGKIEGFNSR